MGVGKEVCAPADTEFPSHWAARLTVREERQQCRRFKQPAPSLPTRSGCLQSFSFDCFIWDDDNIVMILIRTDTLGGAADRQ